ncbi:MAG: tRNA (cytidine(34)-2'-O)-methyltransferase [Gammaproteobacteria bacterium]|nr:tRNA (cytidine(34)-2'-O)-methyltransferase [Gammaproteobacteria bacterium]
MLNVVLYQPEIPPNTGNIIRLCANTGTRLHLVGPMGFVLDDARLRRAGLDYAELTEVSLYRDWSDWLEQNREMRLWGFSTLGRHQHTEADFRKDDGLLFGPETRGLPGEILSMLGPRVLRLPMKRTSRSLNLSNSVAIGLYEALRQLEFTGLS